MADEAAPSAVPSAAPVSTKPLVSSGKLGATNRTEVDFTKQWSDGHKSFNSAQVRALDELIHNEMGIRDRYESLKGQLRRPRNPLTGEETPRDSRGNIVMNPAKFHTVANGSPLFNPDYLAGTLTYTSPAKPKKELVGKIGVPDGKYEAMGNTGSPARTDDMYGTIAYMHEKKKKLREEQLQIGQCIAREKAKRYRDQLQREILALHHKAEDRTAEINILKSKYNL